MTLKKDFIRGVKLAVVLFLGSLLVIVPQMIAYKINTLIVLLVIAVSLVINGYLVKKFKKWIFR